MSTPFHSQYWAHALTLQGESGSIGSLSRSIASARVDLNPHQVDAALFAVRSPLSKGVILADEVGLGKTIEAGIVLSQRWAERRRRILLILPATLRKQWQQELAEKFALPSVILESASFNAARRAGITNPFERPGELVICSYHFAAAKADEVRAVRWDLVVIDEAHRLRNVYKTSSKMAAAIRDATAHAPKLLLTATPLQNSLLELYGLVSVIDPHVFGDLASFRERFVHAGDPDERNARLRERLRSLAVRTLRRQVLEYIRFTRRVPLTQEFFPSDEEHRLYELVSEYLRRERLAALPAAQRELMTLVLRKLLASSTFAIAGTLRKLIARLEGEEAAARAAEDDAAVIGDEDFDVINELADEWDEGDTSSDGARAAVTVRELAAAEVAELRRYAELAEGIGQNAKGVALLTVLRSALDEAERLGAARKAVVFTESRRTQRYLVELLSKNGYAGQVVIMNGTNTDPESRAIYERWSERHAGSGLASGSRSADMKAAIIEEFRDRATILVATESAAEGVNLQFCSLVVNYDLPWNPQRVEQRIGRCHRYGQKHDVVVVNFLNKRNEADQRVYELLAQKFNLFEGIFGASDEVLGALESGVDLERRIAQVYQECRTPEEIQTAFDQLQAELDEQIAARMAETRQALFEHFDEEVHARLRVHRVGARAALDERQQWLLELTRQELDGDASFEADAPRFHYQGPLARPGHYNLDWRDAERREDIFYRLEDELAQCLVEGALARELPPRTIVIGYGEHRRRQSARVHSVEPYVGRSGWLELSRLRVDSLRPEEFLVLAGRSDDGVELDEELCHKLLQLPARMDGDAACPPEHELTAMRERRIAELRSGVSARNRQFFDEEIEKLERWADDMRLGLERELKELNVRINEAKRASRAAVSLEEKLAAQKQLRTLEQSRNRKRRDLYDAQDAIDARRDEMIAGIERQLAAHDTVQRVFTVRWRVE
ncbi:MAG TPA: SNF2-related protein [Gemmatimonadaceae bacterium]|nr:SNF2-related protein [Gemmatimonadaceae bacterium]